MLLGRDAELAQVAELAEEALAGRAQTLVVHGGPGTGKSELLRWTAQSFPVFRVAGCTGFPVESAIPNAALSQILRSLDIAELDPPAEFDAALQGVLGSAPAPPAQGSFVVGVATLWAITESAARTPLLVVVDDVQWVDEPSARALAFTARRLQADAVFLILAERVERKPRQELWGLPRLPLHGLSEADAKVLLQRNGRSLTSSQVQRLLTMTGGNPLALIQAASIASEEQLTGVVPPIEPVPVGKLIESAYEARLRRIPESSRRAAVTAAILSDRSTRVLSRSLGRIGLALTDLGPLEEERLLSVQGDQVSFEHPMVRSAVVHMAPSTWRRQAHAAAAEALAGCMSAEDEDRRTWHRAAAALGPDEDIAEALTTFAGKALSAHGYSAAMAAFTRAAELSASPADAATRFARAAEAGLHAGALAQCETLLRRAASEQMAEESRGSLRVLSGQLELARGNPSEGLSILAAEAATLGATQPVAGSLLYAHAAVAAAWTDTRMAVGMARKSAELGDEQGGQCRDIVNLVLGGTLSLAARGHEATQRLSSLLTTRAYRRLPADWVSYAAIPFIAVDDFDAARLVVEEAISRARESGALGPLQFALASRAVINLRTGAWGLAEADLNESLRLAADTGRHIDRMNGLAMQAGLQAARGQRDPCLATCEEGLALAREAGSPVTEVSVLGSLGQLRLSLLELDAALAALTAAERAAQACGALEYGHYPWITDLIEAYAAVGQQPQAQLLLEVLQEHAARNDRPLLHAWALRAEGLLARGDSYDASFSESLGWHGRSARPLEQARTQLLYGERLRRSKRRRDAKAMLRPALETFGRLGAQAYRLRARRELEATGEVTTTRTGVAEFLTPQETQVASLVAKGATNKEVAAALFLSQKTVEYHLSKLFQKMQVGSRKELALRFERV